MEIKHGNIIHHLLYKQDGIEYPKQEEIPFEEDKDKESKIEDDELEEIEEEEV